MQQTISEKARLNDKILNLVEEQRVSQRKLLEKEIGSVKTEGNESDFLSKF